MDMAYYFQGLISLDLGQKERAREELSRALQFNPDNERIAEELSKLDA